MSGREPGRAGGLDRSRLGWLAAGAALFVAGTWLGWNGGLLEVIARPPAVVRAALVAASTIGALALLVQALRRLEAGRHRPSGELSSADLATLVRGVRYVFLAVAALSAAAGWLLGHPLPFIIALVIAGVDVLETSFLLLIVTLRGDR